MSNKHLHSKRIPTSHTGSKRKRYKKKNKDIVCIHRPDDIDESLIDKFKNRQKTSEMECHIKKAIFRNELFNLDDRLDFENGDLIVKNIRMCITTSSFPSRDGDYIFVGVKNVFDGQSTFTFASGESEIYLFDKEMLLRHVLRFSYGYCRKIKTRLVGKSISCVALFSDGIIRRFEFNGEVTNMREVNAKEIVDIEVNKNHGIIFATNGSSVIWISGESIVSRFGIAKGLITSIAIREPENEDGSIMEHKKSINRNNINESTIEFYALSLSGKIITFDFSFQEVKNASFPSGYTFIKTLESSNNVLIVDTLNNSTKTICSKSDMKKTSAVFNYSISCLDNYGKSTITGGFDGVVRCATLNKRNANEKPIFQLVRRSTDVLLGHLHKEFKIFDPQGRLRNDFWEKVVGVHVGNDFLYALYSCGIIIIMKLS
ncbi:hypothetical protein M896_030440 [Ordospora colligata OC4]|uniref:Uncharacterized protein n=1 Tax=Ordospora colligata OC4 TaxID=1354746 RepID=A0A0B2UL14_9MICR|nr:uncharacterized protein M896_030440 [Ordospora colligata OC4]KHN70058.1 hypothetical protein M896_030440 [Ordospora colligata OC4]TBU16440.1 hypothetical protein CWI41_030400 [Ordospora colligata]TBU16625.1 hypothetical protein CWI40_030800 [Ordospora colligata]